MLWALSSEERRCKIIGADSYRIPGFPDRRGVSRTVYPLSDCLLYQVSDFNGIGLRMVRHISTSSDRLEEGFHFRIPRHSDVRNLKSIGEDICMESMRN